MVESCTTEIGSAFRQSGTGNGVAEQTQIPWERASKLIHHTSNGIMFVPLRQTPRRVSHLQQDPMFTLTSPVPRKLSKLISAKLGNPKIHYPS